MDTYNPAVINNLRLNRLKKGTASDLSSEEKEELIRLQDELLYYKLKVQDLEMMLGNS